jgi:hypothetical protein
MSAAPGRQFRRALALTRPSSVGLHVDMRLPRTWLGQGRLLSVAVVAVATIANVAGCAAGPQEVPDLGVNNGTTLPVAVVVNGSFVKTIAPGQMELIAGNTLPPLPWGVDARSPSGRVLLHVDVAVGSVWSTTNPDGSTERHGAANRVDLSCGRLDVYAGPPLAGPMPNPGSPGDCDR